VLPGEVRRLVPDRAGERLAGVRVQVRQHFIQSIPSWMPSALLTR
jgi:hypothetical protein